MTASTQVREPSTAHFNKTFSERREFGKRAVAAAVLIALGALSGLQVMGFTVTLFSGICLLVAPALLLRKLSLGDWIPIALATVGLGGFLISSRLNAVSVLDQRVFQWAAFGLYFIGLLVLAGKDLERVFALATGVALGSCIYFSTKGLPALGTPSIESFWKYAYAPWLTLICLYALVLMRVSLRLQAVALILLACASLVLNYRSHALVCLGAAAVLLVTDFARGRIARWLQFAFVGVAVAAFGSLLPAVAKSGVLGAAIQEKTELQDSAGVPSILAGRTESPLSVSAIIEKPWFGWGSANNITNDVFDRGERFAARIGFDSSIDLNINWHLPNGDVSLHSTFFNAWAEGGVFAALLPIGLLCAAFAVVWNSPRYGLWGAMAVVIAIQAIWDLLFSPTSYNILPIFAVLAVVFASVHLVDRTDRAA
ncbi:O-antigen ligase family protein [Antrihabitans stalactiti]|uniref:O-antigen ligase-related domain-containing protein n=1 Tax=Antrihabitans stalactiti TaxID=2584121 RepID=A0A848KHL0_9NOCA|nr:O-antigen ligase family protein [Antrihabitans stalactiti]NMN97779.1 hypothetical protein [Antrihabitans stalactiti]